LLTIICVYFSTYGLELYGLLVYLSPLGSNHDGLGEKMSKKYVMKEY